MDRLDIFLLSCLCFVGGVLAAAVFSSALDWAFFIFLFSVLVFVSVLTEQKKVLWLAVPLLLFFGGNYRMSRAEDLVERPELSIFYGQAVKTEGWVCEDPSRYDYYQKAVVCAYYPEARILVETGLESELRYGQRVSLDGVLQEPVSFSGFDYKSYLSRKGVYFVMDEPQLELLPGQKITWRTVPIHLKNKLEKSLEKTFAVPWAGFFEALIFGDEDNIPGQWKEILNTAGVRHIVAVSGTNITILSSVILNFFIFLGLWRQQAFWVTLGFLFVYVVMIGAPACAVRAGLMGGLLLLATYNGRVPDTERLSLFTLALMLFFTPLAVFDTGFQLSFLAFLGLVYLSSPLSRLLSGLPSFFAVKESVVSTLSAQIFVLPLLLFSFGRLSLVSPLANIIVLPFVTFLTIFSFGCALLSLLWLQLGVVVSFVPQLILMILMAVMRFLASFSWAEIFLPIPSWFTFFFYAVLALFVYYWRQKEKYFLKS